MTVVLDYRSAHRNRSRHSFGLRERDQIVVSGRHGEAGEELAQELSALGAETEFICADVRHDDEMRKLVDQTVKRFGRLDVAVNNAGTEGHPQRPAVNSLVTAVELSMAKR